MRMAMMANNSASRSTEILNAAANAITSINPRRPPPHQHGRWKGYWSRFWCFGPQKRTKRIVPAYHVQEGNATEALTNGAQQAGGAHQLTTLSTSLSAPPSSPASFLNSGNSSTIPSPSGYLPLSSMSGTTCSPGRPISNMFAVGPYAHETQLVSPPVFSTLTTEPSTAPFTPPPELAQLTNPPSPEVPFAHLLQSSSNAKETSQDHGLTFSSFPFISSGYGATNDLLSAYQLYPGSPAGSLLSPRSGFSGSAPSSPFPDLEFPAQWKVLHSAKDSPFSRNEHSNPFNYRSATSGTSIFSKGSNAFFSATSANFKLDHVSQRWSFGGQSSIEPQLTGEAFVCCNSENMEQERHLETNKCCTNVIHKSSVDILVKFPMENSQMQMEQELNRASFELVTDEIKLVTDEITKASSRPIEVLVERLPLSCTEAQNSYAGEYSTSSNRCVREDIHLTELALPNNQTEVSTIDPLKCFTGHARDGVVKD
ncbi:uncharacterized protein At1g76660 [Cryptomeria japonica]|uniref:uncharacterized protein At1g76660 n=1 Tax=Cryptomeria japonica TaxID=3369 RepID=UPI0027DA8A97|nr:uncharacterized protein At1g76660 [Cryptomeria japonica]XP_057857229.2 uncharacterized protein At1g76660 [Cryptomeria japonica]